MPLSDRVSTLRNSNVRVKTDLGWRTVLPSSHLRLPVFTSRAIVACVVGLGVDKRYVRTAALGQR